VDATVRGQGIGRLLVQKAIELAHSRDAEVLELTTNRKRTGNIPFYEGLGFHVTSDKLVYPLKEGVE
jgi:GNAT superfamily N-acetyltransferase